MSLVRVAAAACFFVVTAGCSNPLYAPCTGADCAEGLRCVDLGDQQRLCTKTCTVTKDRAGYPDGFDDDTLFEDGGAGQTTVTEPQCADAAVDITSQDNAEQSAQNIAVQSDGVVGVCRVSAEQLADESISGDTQLLGFCAPL